MNLLGIFFQLFVMIFNKFNTEKKVFFELGNNYQLELHVNKINITQPNKNTNNDCALIPLKDTPKHDLI
tara:strand:+ start:283 stop:489 length:207 start_codon:yes stop_codon:yes gene_type:complete